MSDCVFTWLLVARKIDLRTSGMAVSQSPMTFSEFLYPSAVSK